MMTARRWFAVIVLVCLVGCVLTVVAQETSATPDDAPVKMSLWDLLKQGGWAMYPLAICSFALIALVVMNFRQLNRKTLIPPDALAEITTAAEKQDIGAVWRCASSNDSFFTKPLTAGLRHIDPDDPVASKPRMEEAISEVASRQESEKSFWINFLSLVAGVSPMLGLLGTVSGMIGAFQKIGSGGMGKPEILAADIGEALITTATGLVIAIPAMFFFFLFRNMLNRILVNAEEQYSLILDNMTGSGIAEIVTDEVVEQSTEQPE